MINIINVVIVRFLEVPWEVDLYNLIDLIMRMKIKWKIIIDCLGDVN